MDTAIYEISKNPSFSLPYYVTGAAVDYVQGRVVRSHDFPHHQVALCLSGCGIIEYGGEIHHIHKNDLFFYSNDISITYYSEIGTENWLIDWVTFQGSQIIDLLAYIHLSEFEIIRNMTPHAETLFRACYTALQQQRYMESSIYLHQILYEIYISKQSVRPVNSREINALLPVIHYITEHYNSDIELQELADIVGVTKSYLCRTFKQNFNSSPMEYVSSVRIAKAKHYLLNNPEMSVSEISQRTGFKSCGYFCRAFKQSEQLTPLQYRKIHTR